MINRNKYPLFVMILACTCIASAAQEPNQCRPPLKFEIDNKELPFEKDGKTIKSPIRPTYAAEFSLFAPQFSISDNQQELARILETTAGQSVSQQQKDFLTVTDAWFTLDKSDAPPHHHRIHVYAISEKDSHKMAEAFIESIMSKNNAIARTEELMYRLGAEGESLRDDISKYEAELPTELAKFRKYREDINNVHYISTHEAEQTISELNKMLDNLNIELAGLKAKMMEVQSAAEQLRHSRVQNQQDKLFVLEQTLIDYGVELSIAQAKKESANQIRTQAEEFCRIMNAKQLELHQYLYKLQNEKIRIELEEHRLFKEVSNIELKRLAEVYGNKVKIHQIAGKQ